MLAGAAEIDITPPVGSWIVGNTTRSTGVHDPLHARALVLAESSARDSNRGGDRYHGHYGVVLGPR